jgi:hypothetical protein
MQFALMDIEDLIYRHNYMHALTFFSSLSLSLSFLLLITNELCGKRSSRAKGIEKYEEYCAYFFAPLFTIAVIICRLYVLIACNAICVLLLLLLCSKRFPIHLNIKIDDKNFTAYIYALFCSQGVWWELGKIHKFRIFFYSKGNKKLFF